MFRKAKVVRFVRELSLTPAGHGALRDEIAQLKRLINHVDRHNERRRREQTA
jgi:hypothetical protein